MYEIKSLSWELPSFGRGHPAKNFEAEAYIQAEIDPTVKNRTVRDRQFNALPVRWAFEVWEIVSSCCSIQGQILGAAEFFIENLNLPNDFPWPTWYEKHCDSRWYFAANTKDKIWSNPMNNPVLRTFYLDKETAVIFANDFLTIVKDWSEWAL